MEKNYKAICLDLDGTLLNKESKISEANKESLRKQIKKKKKIFLVTGRPYCYAKYQAREIDEEVKVISFNGACYEMKNEIVEYEIDSNSIQAIINIVEKYHAHAFFKAKENIYTHEAYDQRFVYDAYLKLNTFPLCQSYNELTFDDLRRKVKHILKVLIYDFNIENLNKIRSELNQFNLSVTSSNSVSVDIMNIQADKGKAIKEVMKESNISLDDVIAFGDSENDLPMVEVCGKFIAMGNATEDLKKKAYDVTKSNDEDGISWYLENMSMKKIKC